MFATMVTSGGPNDKQGPHNEPPEPPPTVPYVPETRFRNLPKWGRPPDAGTNVFVPGTGQFDGSSQTAAGGAMGWEDPISYATGGTDITFYWSDGSFTVYHFNENGDFESAITVEALQSGGGSGSASGKCDGHPRKN